ncbi:MAG: hypothetical protein ACYC1E_09655 [Propionibacteriaceae bacterium]
MAVDRPYLVYVVRSRTVVTSASRALRAFVLDLADDAPELGRRQQLLVRGGRQPRSVEQFQVRCPEA